MIKRYLMLSFVLLGLSSCESTVGPSFEEMIPEDLSIYNEGLEPDEQVVCQPAHSDWIDNKYRHVPKWCKTVGYIKNIQNRTHDDWAGAGYGSSIGGDSQPADAADYHSGAFNGGHND